MAAPGLLLVLGGVLSWVCWGGVGSLQPPPEKGQFEEEAELLLAAEPQDPKCFSRLLHDLHCFWEAEAPPDPNLFLFQFRGEHEEEWHNCSTSGLPLGGSRSRFWCSPPPESLFAFIPLELRVLQPPPAPPLERSIAMEQVVLVAPPSNVSVGPGGGRGQLCVRWQPPPVPYLESSLVYELLLQTPGLPPRTVEVAAGRREQLVGGLRGRSRYSARLRGRPDGLSYSGFWSQWSQPGSATTPPDVDPVTLGLSCLLALLLLALGLLVLLGHRRMLQEKFWPPVPGPEREFEELFSAYGGNFQLWLFHGVGAPWTPPGPPPDAEELPVEEVRLSPSPPPPEKAPQGPPQEAPPPIPCPPPAPAPPSPPPPDFEYTFFAPPSALLCGPPPKAPSPYANLGPPPAAKWGPSPSEPLRGEPPSQTDPPQSAPPTAEPPHSDPPRRDPPKRPPPTPPPLYVICS